MQRALHYGYELNTDELKNANIKLTDKIIEQLENQVKERIYDQEQQGFREGELCCMVVHEGEDYECRGWWKLDHGILLGDK